MPKIDPQMDSKLEETPVCFVIGPIGKDGSDVRKQADLLFHSIVKPVAGEKYTLLRADMEQKPGLITDAIIKRISESALVVADFSTLNPNVFYELGIRHAAAKATIHMAAEGTPLPFDNAGNRVIFYDLGDWHQSEKVRAELDAQIRETEKPDYIPTNPVTQALTMSAFKASPDTEEKALARLAERVKILETATRKPVPSYDNEDKEARQVNAGQLVESINNQTEQIANRRSIVKEALGAMIEEDHVFISSDTISRKFITATARDIPGYNKFVAAAQNGDFATVQEMLNAFDDLPF